MHVSHASAQLPLTFRHRCSQSGACCAAARANSPLPPCLPCFPPLPTPLPRSLWECGGGIIADGRLLDLIRRVYTFGMCLLKLDLRQESTRHADALDAVTTYLGYGSYKAWDEDTKLDFLTRELVTKRPLIPLNMPMSDEVGAGRVLLPANGGALWLSCAERAGGCRRALWCTRAAAAT